MPLPNRNQILSWSAVLFFGSFPLACGLFFSPGWAIGWGQIPRETIMGIVAATVFFAGAVGLVGLSASLYLALVERFLFARRLTFIFAALVLAELTLCTFFSYQLYKWIAG